MAVLGTALVAWAVARAPLITPLALLAFAGVWWLRRDRRVRILRFHRGRLRREIITSGLLVAALWVVLALSRAAIEIGREPVGEEPRVEHSADAGPWPGEFMIDGLLATLGVTYILLAIGHAPRRRRRRRTPDGARDLAPLTAERDSAS